MTHKTAEKWAAVFSGRNCRIHLPPAAPHSSLTAESYGARPRTVGEEYRTHCMIVTQAAWFRGYVGMPCEDIPQFIPGEREKRAKEFLEEQVCIFCRQLEQ
jgi:hypothetical protein